MDWLLHCLRFPSPRHPALTIFSFTEQLAKLSPIAHIPAQVYLGGDVF